MGAVTVREAFKKKSVDYFHTLGLTPTPMWKKSKLFIFYLFIYFYFFLKNYGYVIILCLIERETPHLMIDSQA